jgi:hypothetical protein
VADHGDAGQGSFVQVIRVTPLDGRAVEGTPLGGQDGSPAKVLGKSRTVTSIVGSPCGTPSCDLPCRRPFVAIGEFSQNSGNEPAH